MLTGEKIKRLRKERNMTQEELGSAIGVQKAAINKYETGIVSNLKKKTIQNLAAVFNVNPVWLMDDASGWPPVPNEVTQEQSTKATPEIQILARGLNKMTEEQQKQLLDVARIMFAKLFDDEGDE